MKSNKIKIGYKMMSTNTDRIDLAKELINQGVYDYIELTPVPLEHSRVSHIKRFLEHPLPYIIHVPASKHGFNMGDGNNGQVEKNIKILDRCMDWADKLHTDTLILHTGFGNQDVALRFIERHILPIIKDNRDYKFLLENMPYYGEHDGKLVKMIGSTPEFFDTVKITGIGLCLDINHCIKTGMSLGYSMNKTIDMLHNFFKLRPEMYHLSNGHIQCTRKCWEWEYCKFKKWNMGELCDVDEHLPLGDEYGQYDIPKLIKKILNYGKGRFGNYTELITLEINRKYAIKTPTSEDEVIEDY